MSQYVQIRLNDANSKRRHMIEDFKKSNMKYEFTFNKVVNYILTKYFLNFLIDRTSDEINVKSVYDEMRQDGVID